MINFYNFIFFRNVLNNFSVKYFIFFFIIIILIMIKNSALFITYFIWTNYTFFFNVL